MKKLTLFAALFVFIAAAVAQKAVVIDLEKDDQIQHKPLQIKNESNALLLTTGIKSIVAEKENTRSGEFYKLQIEGLQKQYGKGFPNIPVFSQLIEVPGKEKYNVKVMGYEEKLIDLEEHGITYKISPAQFSISKSADEKDIPHYYDEAVYNQDEFLFDHFYKINYVGEMRGKHLARIEIYPLQYNPVHNKLKVLQNLEIAIEFEGQAYIPDAYQSPVFNNSVQTVAINSMPGTNNKALSTEAPIKYVIIADRMFESALQDFIAWKTISGFQVIVGYTDDDNVGNTTTSIKAYLQDLYENPPAGEQAPTYVLFVGDDAQIPAFDGDADSHVTDLHYCEYTGDYLPEVLYGRFSAESVAELEPQLAKTLEYEQYSFSDNSFLDEVVMVAGVDGTYAPSHGNGQIYYGINEYFNAEHDITSHTYLYGSGSTITSDDGAASAAIIGNISDGVGFANYTAHCSSDGWADPEFEISDIDGLSNAGKYPTMIGNCCLSNKFEVDDCFGEKIVMAEDKGAIGYIGGTNSTYWDEDFWFGVGLNTLDITSGNADQHTYDNTELGAYDGLFHENGEDISDWYITNTQLILCGNLAVESSTSTRKLYYWEIYSLFGDPSLMTYLGIPEDLTASYNDNLTVGATSLSVTTEAYAHVTLSEDGVVLDTKIADASGIANLSFDALANPGTDQLDIIITAQNKVPHMEKITVINPSGPYITINSVTINDATGNANGEIDFGEEFNLVVEFKNVGQDNATNVTASITTDNANIVASSNNTSINIGTINAGASLTVSDKFNFEIADDITDQLQIVFASSITDDSDETYTSDIVKTANAPELYYDGFSIDDSETGNGDGILDPAESAKLVVQIINKGNADVTNINGTLTNLNGSEAYLSITDGSFYLANLPADDVAYELEFTVEGVNGTDLGTPADFDIDITAGTNNQYTLTENDEIIIGEIPEYLISEGGTHNVNVAYFFDSGGDDGVYSNDEDYTITFTSQTKGLQLVVDFEVFSIEDMSSGGCWDYLEIYNGTTVDDATKIGEFCDADPPTTIISDNAEGALTFRFVSDFSETQDGWRAYISRQDLCKVFFTVDDGADALENATIEFNEEEMTTDANGEATFTNIPKETISTYYITKYGYEQVSSTLTVDADEVYETVSLTELPAYAANFEVMSEGEPVENAEIEINNGLFYTDDAGNVQVAHLYNQEPYPYTINAAGFFEYTDELILDGADTDVQVELIKLPKYVVSFTIEYEENPVSGAIVTFADSIKTTDASGIVSFHYYNGTYDYTIEAETFNMVEGSVAVNGEEENIVETLTKKEYAIDIVIQNSETEEPVNDAVITIDETEYVTNSNGLIAVDLEHGTHALSGTAYGYHDLEVVDITIDKDSTLTYTMDLQYFTATFKTINAAQEIVPGASITFRDTVFTMDENGEKSFVVSVGTYDYSIEADDYFDKTGSVDMEAKDTTFTIQLDLFTYATSFTVTDVDEQVIEGAEVKIDEEAQTTDASGIALFNLVPGNHDCVISAATYETDSTTIAVSSDTSFTIALRLIQFNAVFEVEDEDGHIIEGAEITIGDASETTDDTGKASFVLAPGEYTYSIEATGFVSITDEELVIGEEDVAESVTMLRDELKYAITFNVMNMEDEAMENSEVTINAVTKFTDAEGTVVFEDFAPGSSVDYEVVHEGYETETGNIASMNADTVVVVHMIEGSSIAGIDLDAMQIYPNPTSGKLTINGVAANTTIALFDITGNLVLKKLMKEDARSTSIQIDFAEKGIYILEVSSDKGKRVFRVVKE